MPKKKTENQKPETVHISVLIDESGSMGHLAEGVVGAFNAFLADMREGEAEAPARLSLAMFDLSGSDPVTRVRIDNVPLEEVTDITAADYRPRGMTPLNDAVATAVRRLDKRLGEGDRAMLVVMTDGFENASETSSGELRKQIIAKEKAGWEFIYLGANQDSWAESQKIAMAAPGKAFNWDASEAGLSDALAVTAERAKTFRDRPAEYEAESVLMRSDVSEERKRRGKR